MIVRKANRDDTARIAEIERAVFSDAWSKTGIEETLDQQTSRIYVGEEENEIVGYVIAYTVLDEGEVARIAVSSDFRRRGVAEMLLDKVISDGKESGVCMWYLEVRESNVAAQKLYKKKGFEETGLRKDFYEKPKENAVLMNKSLETLSGVQKKHDRL